MSSSKYRRGSRDTRVACLPCRAKQSKCNGAAPECASCLRRGEACAWPHTPSPEQPLITTSQALAYTTSDTISSVAADFSNMELLYHFTTVSAVRSARSQQQRIIRREVIPRLGFKHLFLLHAIFASSAVDLAHIYRNPESRRHNFALFRQHTQLSFDLLPSSRDAQDSTLSFALYLHTMMTSVNYLMSPDVTVSGWRPKLLAFISSCRTFFSPTGSLGPPSSQTAHVQEMMTVDPPQDMPSFLHPNIVNIHSYTSNTSMPDLAEVQDEDISRTYRDAVTKLSIAYSLVDENPEAGFPVLFIWPLVLPKKFVDYMQEKRARALIILAHFHILSTRIIAGHIGITPDCDADINKIIDALGSEEWRDWLRNTLPISTLALTSPISPQQ